MKKLLLSVMSLLTLTAFSQSQWTVTTIFSTGDDCFTAFGKVLAADLGTATLDASSDNGSTWASSSMGVPATGIKFGTLNGATLYGHVGNNIYQTTTGNNWTLMSTTTTTNDVVKSMCVVNGTVFATTSPLSGVSSKLYQLVGSTWTLKQSFPSVIYTVIRPSGATLWAGTTATLCMKSTNGGSTFTNSSGGLNPPNWYQKYVFSFGATSTGLFMGTYDGKIIKSLDGGTTWNTAYNTGNGSTFSISDIFIMPNNNILAATDSGFVYSSDNGLTWGKSNVGLNYLTSDYELAKVTANSTHIFVSTKGGKIYRRLISQIFSGINENSLTLFESKVFPNPATGNTTIQADDLMNENNCLVKLHDVLGREITEVEMQSGKANISADNFSKGLYTYTIYNNKQAVGKGKIVVN